MADVTVVVSPRCLLLTLLQVLVGQWCDSCDLDVCRSPPSDSCLKDSIGLI